MIITTNKPISQESKVKQDTLLNLSCFIVERSQVFNLRAAKDDLSSVVLVAAYQMKLADRNVCSERKADFINKTFRNSC